MTLLRQKLVGFTLVAIALAAIISRVYPPTPRPFLPAESRTRAVLVGEVRGVGRRSPRGWTLEVALERLDDARIEARPRVRLFLPRDQLSRDQIERALPPARAGDRLKVFARLERYPDKSFPALRAPALVMAGRGIEARAIALEPIDIFASEVDMTAGVQRWLAGGRSRFERHLLDILPDQQAALAVALTTGNRAFVEPETAAPFRHTGTSHLLAISGLHLGVLAALLWWLAGAVANRFPGLLRRYGRRRVCGVAVIVALGLYVLAIGAPVSAVRAWVAIAVGVAALVLVRQLCPFHALAAAALGLIVCQPAVVLDLGFQLSFAATLGILLFLRFRPAALKPPPDDPFSPPEPARRRRLRRAGLFVGVSTSATLATWPIVAAHFGSVPLAGLVVNLVVTPLVSAVVFPVLAVGAVVSTVVEPAGLMMLEVSTRALLVIGDGLSTVSTWPGAQWVTGAAPWWAVVMLGLAALITITSRWRRGRLCLAAVALVIGLSPGWSPSQATTDGELRVHFIPVGQGDATFVQFPDGTNMLIDGGGSRLGRDPGRFVVVPYLLRLGVDRLDWVVVTHADADHLFGLFAVVDHMRPEHLVFDAREPEASLAELARRAGRAGAALHPVDQGLGRDFGAVGVELVRPRVSSGKQNDASLVVRLAYGPAAVLLPGDVERPAERWLVDHDALRATVLKVPHHGSKTSSSARFLDAVDPKVAVVSAGRFNRFGHPHPRVIARYRRRAVDVFETAQHGLVRVDIGADGRIEVRVVRP